MRYSGSKRKYMKELLPILMEGTNEDTVFIDAFMGGANVISEIPLKNKIGIDFNKYVIALWKDIWYDGVNSDCIVSELSEEEYYDIKKSYFEKDGKYREGLIGYVGNCCSYGGAWFNGYARFNPNKNEDHIKEAYNGIVNQIKSFKHLDTTSFVYGIYQEAIKFVKDINNALIYCDPPYASTKKYESDFDNITFWEWVRMYSKLGYKIYVSEYEAPSDFKCIWHKTKKDGMGTTKKGNKQNNKIEKLFVYYGNN